MGLISIPTISDGTVIDANDVNNPLNTIVNEINGNISYDNLASNSVTTPKIADGAITTDKIANSSLTPSKWTNPYKFSARASTNQSVGAASYTTVACDTEIFDTNGNYSTSTYKYSIPVDGYYQFNLTARIDFGATSSFGQLHILAGGTRRKLHSGLFGTSIQNTYTGSILLYLTSGQTAEMQVYNSAGTSTIVALDCQFNGFLVSET